VKLEAATLSMGGQSAVLLLVSYMGCHLTGYVLVQRNYLMDYDVDSYVVSLFLTYIVVSTLLN
jgi:hypothetical protein